MRDVFFDMARNRVISEIEEAIEVKESFKAFCDDVALAAYIIAEAINKGKCVYFCGNGGSAADAQHMAAELVGRYKKNRRAFKAIALTVDTSVLTAVANDMSYDEVFSRQLEGLGEEGDVLVAISTSGKSKNVLAALKTATTKNMQAIGLVGTHRSSFEPYCDVVLSVPSTNTPRIQETHIMLGHIICGLVEEWLCGD
ncbi:phosphoheptose isomerase [Thermovirga lienii DSM 17291]|jgi:D-sedoheptulose 7-phosphate isomerase|uniref:Phosphoheptose isomerase n=1 Tax=Thermovirga lienii (strain ATCC BAA-1197 / DSM 17291 / Cas60314) TaxID=580340 RepID=G7V5Q9_THELD|nr:D-sedoheptulose 7-phosphate isomerase [Thermovirga lienii]AER66969.1 phosphoheptose isomerase [Thermovirga lienii DSM 17291]KUK42765.1 MAG: Phosphoheptose isomerase [Thermovirga lienii]MDN5319081.1 D-sedoheptulose 7-phosphate isomerase [Thermovirga sp.]MDN5367543.1 D-sedoheptulose 7-phosphate isomerase [Thermovirga sp.]